MAINPPCLTVPPRQSGRSGWGLAEKTIKVWTGRIALRVGQYNVVKKAFQAPNSWEKTKRLQAELVAGGAPVRRHSCTISIRVMDLFNGDVACIECVSSACVQGLLLKVVV